MITGAVWFWLFFLIFFSVIEGITIQLVSIWFAAASLTSMILAWLGAPIWGQIGAFVGVSILLILLTRPLVQKKLKVKHTPMNLDRVIQAVGVVREPVDNLNEKGRVFVQGLEWTARSSTDAVLPIGMAVVVEKIDGVKLIVSPKE